MKCKCCKKELNYNSYQALYFCGSNSSYRNHDFIIETDGANQIKRESFFYSHKSDDKDHVRLIKNYETNTSYIEISGESLELNRILDVEFNVILIKEKFKKLMIFS